MSTITLEGVLRLLPAAGIVVSGVAAGAVGQTQIGNNRAAIEAEAVARDAAIVRVENAIRRSDQAIDANEDEIEQIQRELIRRQGLTELDLQRIQQQQESQGKDLETILRLLESIRRQTGAVVTGDDQR